MADEDEIVIDVAGQPGGPSPDIQAQVDAEQLELMAKQAAERAPIEEEARRKLQEKLDKANAERGAILDLIRSMDARLKALEAKFNG